jgi:hypothetical protein
MRELFIFRLAASESATTPYFGLFDRGDQDSLNSRFNSELDELDDSQDFPACAGQHGNVVSRENGYAVPGTPCQTLFVPVSPKGIHGKDFLLW